MLELTNNIAKNNARQVPVRQSFLPLLSDGSFDLGPDLCFSGLTASSGIAQDLPSRSAPGILPSNAY